MRIAVIGTGNVGSALGGSLARAGNQVTFAARDEAKTREVAQKLGASAAATPADAAAAADVLVLAVPYVQVDELARELAGSAEGKVVIDVTNPLKPDYSGLATEGGPSGAEHIASLLPGAHVVKAFNTLFASIQADPKAHGVTVDAFFATDDDQARSTVKELIRSLGFRPVDAGPLHNAREIEAMAWLNMKLQMQSQGHWNSAYVLLGAPAAATAEA